MIKLCQIIVEQDGKLLYLENFKGIVEVNDLILEQFPYEFQCEVLQFESEQHFQELKGQVINLTRNLVLEVSDIGEKSFRESLLEKLKLQEDLQEIC